MVLMMERSRAMQKDSLSILKSLNQPRVSNQIDWLQHAAPLMTPPVLFILAVFFWTSWTNLCLHHRSIKQHSGATQRLITSILVCSWWLIDSRGAGRLLRSQINWHYSQEFFFIIIILLTWFDTDLLFLYHRATKKLHTARHISNPKSHEEAVSKSLFWNRHQM